MSVLTSHYPRVPQLPFVSGLSAVTTSLGSQATFVMNAVGDSISLPFTYDGANIPDAVEFFVTASSFGAAGVIEATLQPIDTTTGAPSGTAVTGSATVSVNVTSGGAIKATAAGMAGTAALTPGNDYAVVLTPASGSTGNFPIATTVGVNSGAGWPLISTKDVAGAWTRSGATNSGFQYAFKNAAGNYFAVPNYGGAFTSFSLQSYSDSTNPDERGCRYIPPVDETLLGCLVCFNQGSAPADVNSATLNVYGAPTTAATLLASKAIDGDVAGPNMLHTMWLPSAVDLRAGNEYGFVLKATGSSNIAFPRYDYPTNAHLGSMFGVEHYALTRNNSTGNFTADTAKFYTIAPITSRVHDGRARPQFHIGV